MSLKHRFGIHTWREVGRDGTLLFDLVDYVCIECGTPRRWVEHPERGDLSADPVVRAEQQKDRAERLARLRGQK